MLYAKESAVTEAHQRLTEARAAMVASEKADDMLHLRALLRKQSFLEVRCQRMDSLLLDGSDHDGAADAYDLTFRRAAVALIGSEAKVLHCTCIACV